MTSSSNCSYQKYSIIDVKSQCIDGTRAAYYIRFTTNPTSKQKWHIHFEGGGWCYNLKNCDDRSKTLLGSSKDYTNCLTLNFMNTSYFSIKKEKNPLLYNYNVVYVRYCDGGSFAGNKIQNYQSKGKKLYFMGKRIRQSLLDDLWKLHGMNEASDIVFSGSSAGGLAVFLGIDDLSYYINNFLKQNSQHIRIRGIPDSAFFPYYDSPYPSKGLKEITLRPNGPKYQHVDGRWYSDENDITTHRNIYGSKMKDVYHMMGIGIPLNLNTTSPSSPMQQCIQSLSKSADQCIFPENILKYITTPLFILQPLYDSWVIPHVLGVPLKNQNDERIINNFGKLIKSSLLQSLPSTSLHEIFFDSCYHHTFVSWGSAYFVHIRDSSGVTLPSALLQWYNRADTPSQTTTPIIHLQEFSYPCNACCLQSSTLMNLSSSKPSLSSDQSSSVHDTSVILPFLLCLFPLLIFLLFLKMRRS